MRPLPDTYLKKIHKVEISGHVGVAFLVSGPLNKPKGLNGMHSPSSTSNVATWPEQATLEWTG